MGVILKQITPRVIPAMRSENRQRTRQRRRLHLRTCRQP